MIVSDQIATSSRWRRCYVTGKWSKTLMTVLNASMSTQTGERCIDAFFYGLFMDVSILRQNGVTPTNLRRAYVADLALRIGQRATLVPSSGARAYGVLMALSHSNLEKLYSAPGLEQYRPEAALGHA
jgi:hypothetical protein